MKLCKPCANIVSTVYGRNSSSSSSGDSADGASVSTRIGSSQREDPEVEDQGLPAEPQASHPPMRATDLDGCGFGYSSSRANSAFVTAVQKQAPTMTVDKHGRILVHGPNFEYYMDLVPLLAAQLDDLP